MSLFSHKETWFLSMRARASQVLEQDDHDSIQAHNDEDYLTEAVKLYEIVPSADSDRAMKSSQLDTV